LIPLLSFFILKGKCRYCQKPISFQYPLVEIATGIIFILILQLTVDEQQLIGSSAPDTIFLFPVSCSLLPVLCFLFLVSCFLIIIFVYDLKHYIIPDNVVFPAIAITFLYDIFYSLFIIHNSKFLIQFLFSAIGAAIFFLVIVLISRGKWMGVGDIKLAFLMGLILGWPKILVALFSAFLIGAIIGIVLIILGKKTLKSEVPFGPFLVTGTFVALFWGQEIVNFYVQKLYLGAF